jgi:hypothetical protein
MKTIIVSLLLSTVVSTANAKPLEGKEAVKIKTQVSANADSKVWIGVERPADQHLELLLLGEKFEVIHHQFIKNPGTSVVQKMDLKNLEDGTYALFIRSGKEVVKKNLTIQTKGDLRVQSVVVK